MRETEYLYEERMKHSICMKKKKIAILIDTVKTVMHKQHIIRQERDAQMGGGALRQNWHKNHVNCYLYADRLASILNLIFAIIA